MKSLIRLNIFILGCFLFTTAQAATNNNEGKSLKVISIYQIEDSVKSGFDFFTSVKSHKCGGKPSNRYRSYSDHKIVAERKFQLVMNALNHNHLISVKHLGCEDRAMLVDYVGISLNRSK